LVEVCEAGRFSPKIRMDSCLVALFFHRQTAPRCQKVGWEASVSPGAQVEEKNLAFFPLLFLYPSPTRLAPDPQYLILAGRGVRSRPIFGKIRGRFLYVSDLFPPRDGSPVSKDGLGSIGFALTAN
jgi:hypothetical protein